MDLHWIMLSHTKIAKVYFKLLTWIIMRLGQT